MSKLEADIICPNLLSKDVPYSYEEEGMAYHNFVQNIGIDEGSRQITNMLIQLKQEYEEVGVIGFSVGATMSWLCSENNLCNFVIGCYGSRIRDYVNRSPVCPTLLIFPAEEQTFDVDSLINSLEQKESRFWKSKSFTDFMVL